MQCTNSQCFEEVQSRFSCYLFIAQFLQDCATLKFIFMFGHYQTWVNPYPEFYYLLWW